MSSEHRFVYVAQPIDFRGEHDAVLGWVTNLVSGVVAYSPAHAWKIGSQVTELNASIQAGNMHMLDQSAAMVAVMTGDPSVGVPMEVLHKLQNEGPVILLVDWEVAQRSWVLYNLAEKSPNLLMVPYSREVGREVQVPNEMNVPMPRLVDQLQQVMQAAVDRRLGMILELTHYLRGSVETRLGMIERLLEEKEKAQEQENAND